MRFALNLAGAILMTAGFALWLSPPWYGFAALYAACHLLVDAWIESWWPFG